MAKSRTSYVVPECRAVLHDLKYEIAAELGLFIAQPNAVARDAEFADDFDGQIDPYPYERTRTWADLTSREAGAVGGQMTARLIAQAQNMLSV